MEGVRSTCEGDEIHIWGCSDLAVAGVRFTCEGCSDLAMRGSGSPVRVFRSAYGRDDQIYLRGELDSLVQVAK